MSTINPPVKNRRKRSVGWQSRDIVRAAALAMGLYFAARLFWLAHPLFLTAFLGVLFGLAVSSGVDRLSRWRVPRGVGAALIVVTFIGALVAFGEAVAPVLRRQGVELRRKLPESIDRLDTWITAKQSGTLGMVMKGGAVPDSTAAKPPAPVDSAGAATPAAAADSTATLRQRIGTQLSHMTKYLFPVLTSTIGVIAGLLIIIFISIYIASDPGLYHRGLIAMFPHRHRTRVGEVLTAVAAVLRRWLVTQLIAMATIGAVTTVVLLVLHVKAAFALGVIAGLLEFVPTVGPIMSALPAIAMAFLDSPEKALTVALAYVGIQFLENHVLIPLLMKGGVDLPPVLTILAQALMAVLFGFLGLMCAVPLLAAIMVAVRMLYVDAVIGKGAVASALPDVQSD
jgi:predicted PurR-regulated permease PerM